MPNLIRDSSGTVAESYRLHVCVCTCVMQCVYVCLSISVCADILQIRMFTYKVGMQLNIYILIISESKDFFACEMKTVDECVCVHTYYPIQWFVHSHCR